MNQTKFMESNINTIPIKERGLLFVKEARLEICKKLEDKYFVLTIFISLTIVTIYLNKSSFITEFLIL